MIILVLSDEHLRESIRTMGVTLTGDCQYAITQIRELSKVLHPDYVIHAGDIFNQRTVSPEELSLFRSLINAVGIPAERHLTIQGNHDRGKDKAIPQSLKCTSLHAKLTTLPDGTRIYGRDYDSDPSAMKGYSPDAAFAIGVLHYPCKPFNNLVETGLCPADLSNGLTIIGDTHTASLLAVDGKLILSPGCLFPQNKTELCSGTSVGAWAIRIPEHGDISEGDIYRLPLYHRVGIDLTSVTDPAELRAAISDFLEKEKVRVAGIKDACKPPEDIKPVVYVDANVPGVDSDGTYVLIRVSGGVEAKTLSESLETRSSIYDSIDACVKQLFDDEEKAVKVSTLIKDMLSTNDSREPALTLLGKEGVSFNEAKN